MVLIFSHSIDESTNDVIDWLNYYSCDYCVINDLNTVQFENIHIQNSGEVHFSLKISGYEERIITDHDISSVWFRKGELERDFGRLKTIDAPQLARDIYLYLSDEWNSLAFFLLNYLNKKKRAIGDFSKATPNKLDYLRIASNVGLKIPETIITERKSELLLFKQKQGQIISKDIQDIVNIIHAGYHYSNFTHEITDQQIAELPEQFYPSLFQEKLNKRYELRIFFLEDTFYPMALFSQETESTSTDFRNYSNSAPFRTVPFKLPDSIEQKLRVMLEITELDTGSFDLVVTQDGEFYFLEINPVGQFGIVSYPCNYYIENHIANYLCRNQIS